MFARKIVIGAILAAGALSVTALPATSEAAVTIITADQAPPPLREERVPGPRRGYVWAPGYWDWRHHRYAWVTGHWEREHRGYAYVAPRWAERDGHWVMERGRWDRGHG